MELVMQGTSLHQVRMEKICDQLEQHASTIQHLCGQLADVTAELVEVCQHSGVSKPC